MTTVTLQLPDEVFSALRRSPEEFGRALRLAGAIYWYPRDEVARRALEPIPPEPAEHLLRSVGEER